MFTREGLPHTAFLSTTGQKGARWELCEPTPGNERPLPSACHVSVTTGDRIIMFVSLFFTLALSPYYNVCRSGGYDGTDNSNDGRLTL